jgi:hypothetical protein
MNHRNLNKGFGTLDRLLIVLGQMTRTIEPSEGALYDPALRLHDEAFLAFGSADDFQAVERVGVEANLISSCGEEAEADLLAGFSFPKAHSLVFWL